ncbi:MAG TPA: hypothetical protein VNO26_10890 [Candidatus Limnocylindria bacterium]|nr:hypothetical protein [Candidatus Limnocylindria bacterium]
MEAVAALLTAPWRHYPAAALIVLGLATAARGIRRDWRDLHRPPTDPGLGWALVRTLRSTLGGLAACGVGLGWWLSSAPLMLVSALVWLEEMLEISSVLRSRGARVRRMP